MSGCSCGGRHLLHPHIQESCIVTSVVIDPLVVSLPQDAAGLEEDSDAWMAEGPDEVDRELKAAQAELDSSAKAKTAKGAAQKGAADQDFDPGEFAKRMQVRGLVCLPQSLPLSAQQVELLAALIPNLMTNRGNHSHH